MSKSNYRDVPWQRNLIKIPSAVSAKLAGEEQTNFVAGVVKSYPLAALKAGALAHLGIGVINDELVLPEQTLPLAAMGRYSTRNREGWTITHKDLPMVTKTFYVETPNFGDWSQGSHTTSRDRDVYQKDYVDPPGCEILIGNLLQSGADVALKFVVDLALDRRSAHFEENLLFALNLLQENLGTASILEADARTDQLLSTLGLDWQIFPPGTTDEVVRRAIARMRKTNPEQEKRVRERVALFNSLKPKHFIQGQGGLNSYIGALFADDLVVFENVRYGNALYVLFDDWAEVSKRSRIDLLRCRDVRFARFVHSEDWATRFSEFIRAEKEKRGIHDGGARQLRICGV
jgi:hypothetical protein